MIATSDDALEMYAYALLAWFNAGPDLWLRLYCNDIPLDPFPFEPLAYVEASYAGYAPIATLGAWGNPVRDAGGRWSISSGPWLFNVNVGSVAQDCFGWLLERNSRVIFAEAFPIMRTIAVGQPGPLIQLQMTQASQLVVCPDS